MRAGDGDGMTDWLMSGPCLHECVLVGWGYMQIYSDFEQAFKGSKGYSVFLYSLICCRWVKVPFLAFLSQLTLTIVFHRTEKPKVHAIFIVKAIVRTCISSNTKTGFVMVEEPVESKEKSQAY